MNATSHVFTSKNPATQAIIWQGNAADETAVSQAVQSARHAFSTWSLTSLEDRILFLIKLQELISENINEIAECISEETGKALWECIAEAKSMVTKIDTSLEAYYTRTGDTIKPIGTYQLQVRHRPLGVLAVFVPFNFPAHLFNTHVVPAILAGNTVVVKPSEQTPKTAELMFNLWQQADLPSGVVNLVQGEAATGHALATHPDLNGICFTGSFNIGQQLHRQFAGQTEKMLVLEMGGNNPLIVGDIKNIDDAITIIIQSSFVSAGQRCTCTRRLIIVENANTPQFLEKLIAAVKKIRVDYPKSQPEPFMGPVISQAAGTQILKQQQALQQLGGKSLLATTALDENNPALLSPGLIDMTDINAPDEEIFGPLLQIFRVKDLDAAIKKANDTQYGLTAGILSDDKKQYQLFFSQSRAGTVNWNRPTTGISGMAPFGGLGHSGNFRPTGYYAADYCAYPVISLESSQIKQDKDLPPGIL
jgi:succinylglutamic semialdehyde dehydrogenase